MKLSTKAIVNGKLVFKMSWERAKKKKAIPKWTLKPTNKRKILSIYIEAQIKNLNSRTKHEVDHIIPLVHPLICGLHTFNNLQILSKVKNQNKSNFFRCYRELDGRKYYYNTANQSSKGLKIPKKYNRTKKNPPKLAKKRLKLVKSKVKLFKKSSNSSSRPKRVPGIRAKEY
jgi:hypothetical protein